MDQTPKDTQHPSGPVAVNKLKITIDRDLCIGAATCLAIAPQVFVLDNEAKAIILSTADTADHDSIIDAARGCPTAAIIIEDDSGNRIFPK
ncbi:ferredoxin [Candidatus Dojkabacteria bacterium]|uniref:Ferredoxin n=1 Tax=Candidatus Dojkabacteria bacterium TaxID=2099670 RepID=A0A5C7J3L6_9BACT|nr:MAG: ferredoxin [Candidatus Dojkabacteria bacterium]